MLTDIMSSPYTGLALAILTAFSAIFGVYAWRKGKRVKRITYSCSSSTLVLKGTSRIKKVQVLFDGQEIPDLSFSQFYIWNSGNEVINTSDVVEKMPLCIKNNGNAKILEAVIIRSNEPANDFTISRSDENEVDIGFDYFAPGEGCLCQIIHTGASSDLVCDCKIKGGPSVFDASTSGRVNNRNKTNNMINMCREFIPLLGLLLVSLLLYAGIALLKGQGLISDNPSPWIFIPLMIVLWIFSLFVSNKIVNNIEKQYGMSIPGALLKDNKNQKQS